ncbi:glycosyltransferase family 4 protein [Mariniphaga sp.]|uniref:glycosyltransferase family 4 protein n=1 Tax=Mariniphaga sp. TaxID=1954475 RepID=UPI0035620B6F
MKILYFHQNFTLPTQAGGTRSYEMARKLLERGHEVIMVSGGKEKINFKPTNISGVSRGFFDGIDVIQIEAPYSNKDGIAKRTMIFLKFAYRGIQIALKEDYDLLFATSTPLTAGIPGIFSKWFRKRKFIFEVRDLWPELPKALGMKNPFLLWGMSLLEWLSYRKADACIGLSPGICEGIAKRSSKNKRITLVPNGCDLDIFQPGKRRDLKLPGIKPNDTVAVFTGAHGVANGLDAVLDAASELKNRKRTDIVFVFIGDGKMKPALMERAEKEGLANCRFFDSVPKTELNKIVSSADIGLMILANVPAFYYGTSPNKFFDYLSSGLPVLNNYPGWLADLIRENHCGVVTEPDDAKSFAEGLIFLADNPEQRKKFGLNARKLAENSFTRNDLANKFVDFIESVYDVKTSK